MKDKLFNAIGEIDDKFIEEAESYAPKKTVKFDFKKVAAIAASFAIVLLLSVLVANRIGVPKYMRANTPDPNRILTTVTKIEVASYDDSFTISEQGKITAFLQVINNIVGRSAPTPIPESEAETTEFKQNEYLFKLYDILGNEKTYRLRDNVLTDIEERLRFTLTDVELAAFMPYLK